MDDSTGIPHPTSDAEIVVSFEFAKDYAKSYARSKNMLRTDPDEVESIAGEAATVAIKDYDGRGTFQGCLKHIIRNMLVNEQRRRSGKLAKAIDQAEQVEDFELPMHWRPSDRPPGRDRGKAA